MRSTLAYGLFVLVLSSCADIEGVDTLPDEQAEELDVAGAEALLSTSASSTLQCSLQTAGHGLVTGGPATAGCRLNRQCNSNADKPICAAPEDNTCLCTARDAVGTCIAGQCVWHVDPAITTCICVPGQAQLCTPPGGASLSGLQKCASNGAKWDACLAVEFSDSPPADEDAP